METNENRVASLFIVPPVEFLVGVVLFSALLFRQRDLAILAFVILGAGLGARLWSRFSLAGIHCNCGVDKQKVFPDEILTLNVTAENAKFLPVWLRMTVPLEDALRLPSQDKSIIEETALFWYQRAVFEYRLVALRRGVHHVGPPRIVAGDLLGFFPREKNETGTLDVIVYPRLVPLKSMSFPRKDLFGVPGRKSPVQDPVYILGTRDYQHRQPARYIHWKASARYNRLQEKVFEPSKQEKILLVVDVAGFEEKGDRELFEQMIEAAASLAVRFHEAKCSVGFVTNGVVHECPSMLPVRRDSTTPSSILNILARLNIHMDRGFDEILEKAQVIPWGVSCVYFSYRRPDAISSVETYFQKGKIPVTYILCGPNTQPDKGQREAWRRVYRLNEIRADDGGH
ncbi:MAG TPA: DUF58 domain-containing protein [Desulfobacteraceae bacterium]|nr:DUF58 domain-containing protein [Desulfobacteraceae bacterium]